MTDCVSHWVCFHTIPVLYHSIIHLPISEVSPCGQIIFYRNAIKCVVIQLVPFHWSLLVMICISDNRMHFYNDTLLLHLSGIKLVYETKAAYHLNPRQFRVDCNHKSGGVLLITISKWSCFIKKNSPSGEQPECRILVHMSEQPTAGCIAIFYKNIAAL